MINRRFRLHAPQDTTDLPQIRDIRPHCALPSLPMALYTCPSCGMSVNTTCGACDAALVDDVLVKDDGTSVAISVCPNGHGKIKSPMCCGTDMTCTV